MGEAPDADPFDSLLDLESQHYDRGYAAGYRDGVAQSAVEARIFGIEKGFEKFVLMGRLRRRAEMWHAEHCDASTHKSDVDNEPEMRKGMNRLDRHVATLLLLTDGATLATDNSDEAVAEFDDRLKRAQAKVKVIVKILGEEHVSRDDQRAPGTNARNTAAESTADIENLKLQPG